MHRICLITPGSLASNPRVLKEANCLHAAGYGVTVVSIQSDTGLDPYDDDVAKRAPWTSVRIDLRNRAKYLAYRAVQLVASGIARLTGMARGVDIAISPFSLPLMAAARKIQSDLYVAHYSAALPAAAAAARRWNAAYAFDAEDFHPGEWSDFKRNKGRAMLLNTLDRRYLKNAAYISAASQGISKAYATAYEIEEPLVLHNTFPRDWAISPEDLQAQHIPNSIYWFSQTIGPHRGLEVAVEAIGMATSKPSLYLRGVVSPEFEQHLMSLAAACGAEDRLYFLKPGAPDKMVELAGPYSAGLVAETSWAPYRDLCLTNKTFIYLLAGLPSLMSRTSAHEKFADEIPGAAFLYDIEDARSLAAQIDKLFENKITTQGAKIAALEYGKSRFNWDIESQKLCSVIERALV